MHKEEFLYQVYYHNFFPECSNKYSSGLDIDFQIHLVELKRYLSIKPKFKIE